MITMLNRSFDIATKGEISGRGHRKRRGTTLRLEGHKKSEFLVYHPYIPRAMDAYTSLFIEFFRTLLVDVTCEDLLIRV